MKSMKKIGLIAMALSLSASILLVGCDPAVREDPPASEPSTTTSTTEATTTEPSADVTEPSETDETTTATEADPTDPTEPDAADPTDPAPDNTAGDAVAELAKSLIDTPYVFGAAGPDAFDNSGLAYYCLKTNGITAPRRTGELYQNGLAVEASELLPGDLVFYSVDTEGAAQYVGIYIGDDLFVASNNEEKPVSIQNMQYAYFQDRYVGARRYLPAT